MIAFVGHLGNPNEIAALGISETFALLFYTYPVLANMGAVDTLVSTSFGNKQYYLWGVYFKRAIIILSLLSLPWFIAFLFIEDILLFFDQDPIIAEMAKVYFYYRIPSLIIILYGDIFKGFLQALGYFNILTVLVGVQLAWHVLFLVIFIYVLEMNYLGAAVAIGLDSLVGIIFPLIYFKFIYPDKIHKLIVINIETSNFSVLNEWFHWINKDSFKDWWTFLELSIPSTLMSIFEGGIFEVMTILAGTFSINELGAHTILNDLSMKIYLSWAGISIACTALIGQNLGEGNYLNAKTLMKCTFGVGLLGAVVQSTIIVGLHYFVFRFYTNSDEVIDILNTFLIIIIIQTFFDHIQCPLKGIFRALGKQKITSIVLMVCYFAIGGSSFYILAFFWELKLLGLWIGFAIASGVCSVIYLVLILKIDWKEEWDITLKRIQDELDM